MSFETEDSPFPNFNKTVLSADAATSTDSIEGESEEIIQCKTEDEESENNLAVDTSHITFNSFNTTKFNGITWPSSLWEDGPRRSAFQPYKPTTVLTNLQRGNIQAETEETSATCVSWFEKAGRGNISPQDIQNMKDVNEVDKDGLTALMWSSAYGQISSVELLIDEKADVHIQGKHLETALHLAAAGGHHDVIKILLAHGADANAEDEDGNSPLLYAVYGDHPHAVNELLEHGCDIWEINNYEIKAYNLAVEENCIQARLVIEDYIMSLLDPLQ